MTREELLQTQTWLADTDDDAPCTAGLARRLLAALDEARRVAIEECAKVCDEEAASVDDVRFMLYPADHENRGRHAHRMKRAAQLRSLAARLRALLETGS